MCRKTSLKKIQEINWNWFISQEKWEGICNGFVCYEYEEKRLKKLIINIIRQNFLIFNYFIIIFCYNLNEFTEEQ